MGIYIKNMRMPKENTMLWLYPNGSVRVWGQDIDHDEWKTAIEVPSHERLIDASECSKYFYEHMDDLHMVAAENAINDMPTVIETDSSDEVTGFGCKVCNTNCYEAGTDGEMCSAWTKKPTV